MVDEWRGASLPALSKESYWVTRYLKLARVRCGTSSDCTPPLLVRADLVTILLEKIGIECELRGIVTSHSRTQHCIRRYAFRATDNFATIGARSSAGIGQVCLRQSATAFGGFA